jgi:hypothetical protein
MFANSRSSVTLIYVAMPCLAEEHDVPDQARAKHRGCEHHRPHALSKQTQEDNSQRTELFEI